MLSVLAAIYYLGISSCGMQGATKATTTSSKSINIMLCAFLTAFGGGLIRDVVLINTYPIAFTYECLPDITVAIISSIIYVYFMRNKKANNLLNFFIIYTDAAGLGQFISIGVDKALEFGLVNLTVFLSGITTAFGGGILSSLFCGLSIYEIMLSNMDYRFWIIIATILYMKLIENNLNRLLAQILLVLFMFTIMPLCNRSIRTACKFCIIRLVRYYKPTIYASSNINWIIKIYILRNQKYPFYKFNNNNISKYVHYQTRSRALLFHRIMQVK